MLLNLNQIRIAVSISTLCLLFKSIHSLSHRLRSIHLSSNPIVYTYPIQDLPVFIQNIYLYLPFQLWINWRITHQNLLSFLSFHSFIPSFFIISPCIATTNNCFTPTILIGLQISVGKFSMFHSTSSCSPYNCSHLHIRHRRTVSY